ncbi:hypothetical protein Bbelb_337540 [Branchiostoma belcheri]|nr:hypothetical protein Bbelb_337540 [Branchiostoma belcheri]
MAPDLGKQCQTDRLSSSQKEQMADISSLSKRKMEKTTSQGDPLQKVRKATLSIWKMYPCLGLPDKGILPQQCDSDSLDRCFECTLWGRPSVEDWKHALTLDLSDFTQNPPAIWGGSSKLVAPDLLTWTIALPTSVLLCLRDGAEVKIGLTGKPAEPAAILMKKTQSLLCLESQTHGAYRKESQEVESTGTQGGEMGVPLCGHNFLLTEVERRGDGNQVDEIPTDEVESPTDTRFNNTERVTLRIKEVDIEDPTVRDLLDQLDLVGSTELTDLPQTETPEGDHEILEAPSVVDSKPLESPTDEKELPTDSENTEREGKEEFPTEVHTFARAEVATEERDFTEKHVDVPVIISEDGTMTGGLEVPTDEIESPTDEFLEMPTVDHSVSHPRVATEVRLYPTAGEHSEIPTEAREMPTEEEELLRVTPNRFEGPTEENLDLTTEEEGQLETPTEEDDKFLIVVTPEKPTEQDWTTKEATTMKRETELPTSALETVTPNKVDEVEKQLNQTEMDLTGIPDISDEEFLEVPDTETNEIDEIDITEPSDNRVPSSLDSMEFSDEPDLSDTPTVNHLTPIRDAPDSSDDEDYFNEGESGSGEIPPWEIPNPEVPAGPYPVPPTYRPEPPQGIPQLKGA